MNRSHRRSLKRRHREAPLNPNSIEAQWGQALQSYQVGQFDEALKVVRRILVLDPCHANSTHLAGIIAYQRGRLSPAMVRIRRAIQMRGDVASYHSHLGIGLFDAGHTREAIIAYRVAISLEPRHAAAQSNLANALKNLGQLAQAESACRRALSLQGAFADALCNLSNILNGLERSSEALAASRQAIVLKPNYPEVLSNAGNALKEMRRSDEAELSFRRAIVLRPDFHDATANLAGLLRSIGRHAAAVAMNRQAICLNPIFPEVYANLGLTLLETGRYEAALSLQSIFLNRLIACYSLALLVEDRRLSSQIQILASNILLCHWLLGHGAQSAKPEQLAPFADIVGPGGRENAGAYLRYVSLLYEHVKNDPKAYATSISQTLHVIGESHSLAPAHARFSWHGEVRRAAPLFVMGLKMFHLTKAGRDYHETLLKRRLAELPQGNSALFTIGEIDCRPDEGIWHVHKKKGLAWEVLAEETVTAYLQALENALSGLVLASVTLQGVPAPAYSLASVGEAEDRSAFLAMIQMVNRLLREGALARGWSFLDVHAATVDAQGLSNRVWHLDTHHLSPRFYTDAANRYLVTPETSI